MVEREDEEKTREKGSRGEHRLEKQEQSWDKHQQRPSLEEVNEPPKTRPPTDLEGSRIQAGQMGVLTEESFAKMRPSKRERKRKKKEEKILARWREVIPMTATEG